MVWHHCIQQMAAHGKGTQLTPCATGVPRPSKLSDPHFLLMEFPQFSHCRGVTPGRVFKPATKLPRIRKFTCTLRRVVDLPESNQLLNYIQEAVPTLNSCAIMCKHDEQEYYFLLHTIRKNKDNYKYKTHYRSKEAYLYNVVGIEYHIALTGMIT